MFAFLVWEEDGGRCEVTCDDGGGEGADVREVTDGPPMVSVPHLVTNVSLIVTL